MCHYDRFGLDRYVYTFENVCREEPDLLFEDGTTKVIVNTKGTKGEISAELKEVIRYLDDGTVSGGYSRELDDAVNAVKTNEDRRLEYMTMMVHDMEMREEGRAEGRVEGKKDLIYELVRDGVLTAEDGAKRLGLTTLQLSENMAAYKA